MLEIENVSYTYGSETNNISCAVNNINLSINDGEFIGIIGKTGSGKSTLVQMISHLISPCEGRIILDGKDINKHSKDRSNIHFRVGIALQYPENQLFGKNVFEDIVFGVRNKGINDENDLKYIAETVANFVGLNTDLFNRPFFTLSGGEKRKCAIASIIAMEPEVLILDEPTAGLDAKSKRQLIQSIKKYHNHKKNIIILISHVMEEIAQTCDKVLVMNAGKQIYYDTTCNVFNHYKELYNLGLDVPQTKKIISYINLSGYNLSDNIVTPQQATTEILSLLRP